MTSSSDVLILGGGVIGLSLAWRLGQAGCKVTVLDKGEPATEASRTAAGMLLPCGESRQEDDYFRLCLESCRRYPDFVTELEKLCDGPLDLLESGVLYPLRGVEQKKSFEARLNWQKKYGVKYILFKSKELHALYPGLSADIKEGVWFADEYQIDNRKLLRALYVACGHEQVLIEPTQMVKKLLTSGRKVTGVLTSEGRHLAGAVVNAAGSWAGDRALAPAGLKLPVKPIRGQRLDLKPAKPKSPRPRSVIFAEGCYLVPRRDGSVVLGATEEDAGFEKANTVEGLRTLMDKAIALFPPIRDYQVLSMESGLRPATRDGWPLLGATRYKGYFVATGHYRRGILLAPVTADEMARLILKGKTSEWIRPFSLERPSLN